MSQDIADMPGIEAAMERFNVMMPDANGRAGGDARATNGSNATSGGSATGIQLTDKRETNKADAQPAAGRQTGGSATGNNSALPNNGEARNSESNPTDTPAATDLKGQAGNEDGKSKMEDGKPLANARGSEQSRDREGADSGKSRYIKAQERLEKTWEAVNKRKTELDAQGASLEQQRTALARDKAQFEAIRRQAEQPSATPEQALQAAQLRRRDADALRMQAKRAGKAGRNDEAQRLNKQADKADGLADDLNEYAEQLRKNPPVTMQQREQQFEQARKEWTIEACNAFPELNRNGSRLQQVVAQHLNALGKQDPQLMAHPSLIYHVARLADAQIAAADLKAVAARVPVLEKETESLRARIKELEAEATPASGNGVNRLGDEPKDDYTSLRQSAEEIGHGRW